MSAPPRAGSTEGPLCPVCKKKPLYRHSWEEQQECARQAKAKGIPM